jgi:hypothetical protein
MAWDNIDFAAPNSGRFMKEDGSIINIADMLTGIVVVKKGATYTGTATDGALWVDTSGATPILKIYYSAGWHTV